MKRTPSGCTDFRESCDLVQPISSNEWASLVPGKASETDRVTDGAVSPDGTWVVLRTKQGFTLHRAEDLFAANWRDAGRVDLKAVGEAQGEGIAIAADGAVYLTGEGGGKAQPGTFARYACSLKSQNQR